LTASPPHGWRPWCPGAWRAWLGRPGIESRVERREAPGKIASLEPLDVSPRIGEAWFPSVTPGVPGVAGLLLRVCVPGGAPRPPGPPLLPDARLSRAVHTWVAGLVGVEEPEILGLPTLCVTAPPPGITLHGSSGELAGAVALLSHLLGLAPARPVLCSGRLGVPGTLDPIDQADVKEGVLELEAPGAPSLLVTEPCAAEPLLAAWLGASWRRELEQVLALSPRALALEAWSQLRGQPALAEAKGRAAARLGAGHTRALGAWVVGACQLHRGQADQGLQNMVEAERALQGPPAPGDLPLGAHTVEELRAYLGVALLDRLELRRAREVLESTLLRLVEEPPPWDRRRAEVVLQVAGSLHRVRVACGDLDGAARALQRWSLGPALLAHEEARCRGDLAEVHRRAGRLDQARHELERARACLREVHAEERPLTARYQRLFRVRAGLEPPPWPVEPARPERWPQPAEVAETLLCGPAEPLDRWLRESLLDPRRPASLVLQLFGVGVAARWMERTGEPLPVVGSLVEAITPQLGDADPSLRDALQALAEGQPQGWARRCPY
jgi:hypothetical protein